MQAMMQQVFGEAMPTLQSHLARKQLVKVRPSVNVREACCVMAKSRSGLLVMDDEELLGIFTPREVLKRIVSRGKSPDITAVSSVMITNPYSVSPKLTLLEALREMFEQKVSYLVVENDDGVVLGLVDVMEMVCHTAGGKQGSGKGWRDFFDSAMTADKDNYSEVASTSSADKVPTSRTVTPRGKLVHTTRDMDNYSDVFSIGLMTEAPPPPVTSVSNLSAAGNHDTASVMASKDFFFKVVDKNGNFHRVQCKSDSLSKVQHDIAKLLSMDCDLVILKYTDEDDDEVIIATDDSLKTAVEYGRSCKKNALKLNVTLQEKPSPAGDENVDGVYAPPPLPNFSPSVGNVSDSVAKPSPTNLMASLDNESAKSNVKDPQAEDDHSTRLIMVGGVVAALAAIGFIFARRNN
mmetsp:Transcript_15258/g.25357  ORF Transcript_15258/g.25357 Transcript_15258/m.25357 type:complete len:407 (+) Transcript_15258:2-1222(+)